jgi:glycosyltransferase involved in cell wall biosynthesis
MNILYVLNSGNPGGMEQHVLDLVSGMIELGHTVYVWCPTGVVSDWYRNAGATVKNVDIAGDLDFNYIKNLRKFLTENKIEVLHAHELKAVANALLAGFLAKTPVRISHVHTPMSTWPVTGFLKRVINRLQTLLYAIEVNLIGTTEIALTQEAYKVKVREGIKKTKLKIVPNGIDFKRFELSLNDRVAIREKMRNDLNIPKNAFVFGNVSRMTEEKGQEVLIRSFAELLKLAYPEKTNYYLLICGGGKLEASMRKLVAELGLHDRILITGIFPPEKLLKYYCTFDAFVFPSKAEGFGYVLVEAMYMGLPTVASNIPVLVEVAADTVEYFKSGNTSDLAAKMTVIDKQIVEGNATEATRILEAKRRVESLYAMTTFVNNYATLYADLLKL